RALYLLPLRRRAPPLPRGRLRDLRDDGRAGADLLAGRSADRARIPDAAGAARGYGLTQRRDAGRPRPASDARTGSTGEPGRTGVGLDAERVHDERDHVILPDDHRDLDQLPVVVAGGEQLPGGVADAGVGVQLVGGAEEGGLE